MLTTSPFPPLPVVHLTHGHCTPGVVVKELEGCSSRVRPLDRSTGIRTYDHFIGTTWVDCSGLLWVLCTPSSFPSCTGSVGLGRCVLCSSQFASHLHPLPFAPPRLVPPAVASRACPCAPWPLVLRGRLVPASQSGSLLSR